MSLDLSDPLVGAAVVAGLFGLAGAIVNDIVQMVCTRMQIRSKKPPPKPKKSRPKKRRRRWLRARARSPP